MISGLRAETYEEKLRELNLETLEARRTKLDMIQTFKILKGYDNVDSSLWFKTYDQSNTTHATRLSQHPLNLKQQTIPRTEIRRNFFSLRVINKWNSLPDDVKNAANVSTFKSKYSKFAGQHRNQ